MRLKDQLHKLDYYSKVIEAGTIKGGALKALLSQAQMSKVILQLEETIGSRLLVRSKSGIQMTREGEMLYQYAQITLKTASELELKMKAQSCLFNEKITIGAYDSIARYFFPEFLRFFKQIQPDLKIFIKTGKSRDLVKDLKNSQIQLGLIVNASSFRGIKHESVYEDFFGLYVSPLKHSGFQNRLIYFDFSLNDVANSLEKFHFIESICCDNIETVKALTEESMGIGLLPHKVARDGVLKGKLTAFHHPNIKNNHFDKHYIDLCFMDTRNNEALEYFKSELMRYLIFWSRG